MQYDVTEILMLAIVSMLAGGAIAERNGLKGLLPVLVPMVVYMMFQGERFGLVVGVVGILISIYAWFQSSD